YKSAHQVRYYLNIASEVERKLTGATRVEMDALQPQLHVSRDQSDGARLILGEAGVRTDAGPILALCPGATNSRAKRWPAERFAEAADRLVSENGFQTIIVGTVGDIEVAAAVARSMRSAAAVLAG